MKKSYLLISAAVVALGAGILLISTDIELSLVRWANCGPFSTHREDRSDLCKRKL
jgi:hypothetical protein